MRVKGNPIAMPLLWVLSLSLLFQTATFIYVFRELVLKRKVRWFGVCASIALFLMAIRRFLALEELRHDPSFASEMAFAEWLGLILSVLMLVGSGASRDISTGFKPFSRTWREGLSASVAFSIYPRSR
jgi:hypothetical protein